MTPVDIDKLKADYAALGIDPGVEWYALIHKGGYDLCLENARWRPDHSGHDDIIGRFACGDLAIKCLPVIAQALNALPALIAKAERVDALSEALTEAAAMFDQFAAALREHDPAAMAQEIATAELAASEARNALSPKESE